MGRLSGVYEDATTGQWRVDKLFRGQRLKVVTARIRKRSPGC